MAEAVARPGGSKGVGTGGAGGTGGTVSGPTRWARLVAFCQGVVVEMKKVTWPDFAQVRSATIAIIIFVLLLALAISVMDFILQGILIKAIPSLFAGR
jgi:preprotein translocase SecE subunit